MARKKNIPAKLQEWIDARKRFRLSHAQIQMARELGMNPRKLGKLANHDQEAWKVSLPRYIEDLYFKRFNKPEPDEINSIEEHARKLERKKTEKRARKQQQQQKKKKEEEEALLNTGENVEQKPVASGPAGKVVSLAAPVSLKSLVQEFQLLNDASTVYLDKRTAEFFSLTDDIEFMMSSNVENLLPWEQEVVAAAREAESSENYVPLPSKYDLDEYGIMADFCFALEDEDLRAEFKEAIQGRGAFRRFRNLVQHHRVEKTWDEFESRALAELGREWLKENKLSFKEDLWGTQE